MRKLSGKDKQRALPNKDFPKVLHKIFILLDMSIFFMGFTPLVDEVLKA